MTTHSAAREGESLYDRFIRASAAVAREAAPLRHSQQTPDCPELPRFAVARKGSWTTEEAQHVSTCPFCQKVEAMFREAEQADAAVTAEDSITGRADETPLTHSKPPETITADAVDVVLRDCIRDETGWARQLCEFALQSKPRKPADLHALTPPALEGMSPDEGRRFLDDLADEARVKEQEGRKVH